MDFSRQRKRLQDAGLVPTWMSTAGWQLYSAKYLSGGAKNVKEQYERIAKTLAQYAPKEYPEWWQANSYFTGLTWEQAFFNILWDGFLSPSTPVSSNTGTDLGLSVSCSGQVVPDSVYGFYDTRLSTAILTKNGFGTSAYLGDIRPRGAECKSGTASGVLPVFKMFVQDSMDISQGSQRRGAWAGYLPIDHGDYWEVINWLEHYPESNNVGWNLGDDFKARLDSGDEDAVARWKQMLYVKALGGKGYQCFIDKINRARPQMYKDHGLEVKASQLCTEITLFSDSYHDYTCVLSSLCLQNYHKFPDKVAFVSTVFLDCVCEDFIIKGREIKGLEKAVRYTEKARSLGLGVMGFSTLLMQDRIAFGSLDSFYLNGQIFKMMEREGKEASQWMAKVAGEPEWCKGYGVRNTHITAIAPTKSTSLLMGGVTEGINPPVAMCFNQSTPAGEMQRIDPAFLTFLKEKGKYNKHVVNDIIEHKGSVQHLTWMTEDEKLVFRTAYEIDPYSHLNLCAQRQKQLCQMQSINLYIGGKVGGDYISKLYKYAYEHEDIHSLYYQYGMRDAVVANDSGCIACE